MSDTEEAPLPPAPQVVSAGPHALHRLRYTISREIFLYQQQWFVVGIFQLGIFKQKWQDYEAATGLDQKNQLVRLATFRSVVGKECLQIFGILIWLR